MLFASSMIKKVSALVPMISRNNAQLHLKNNVRPSLVAQWETTYQYYLEQPQLSSCAYTHYLQYWLCWKPAKKEKADEHLVRASQMQWWLTKPITFFSLFSWMFSSTFNRLISASRLSHSLFIIFSTYTLSLFEKVFIKGLFVFSMKSTCFE